MNEYHENELNMIYAPIPFTKNTYEPIIHIALPCDLFYRTMNINNNSLGLLSE